MQPGTQQVHCVVCASRDWTANRDKPTPPNNSTDSRPSLKSVELLQGLNPARAFVS